MPARLDRSSRSLRFGVALAAALSLLGATTESRAATNAQCSAQWSNSTADDTCSNEDIKAQGNNCRIAASCTMSNGGNRSDNITVGLNQVSFIENCDGFLTLGQC